MVRNAKWKDCFRAIWKTRNRFFSILCIIAIGVGFFAGLRASGPDMWRSADAYADQQNLMHFRIISTWGFDEEDIAALSEIPGAYVRPSYFLDTVAISEWGENVARVYAYQPKESINELELLDGTWPRISTECLVESSSGLRVGDTITFISEGVEDSLSQTTYTVSGVVRTAMYFSMMEKGNTNIGSGKVGQILFVPYKNFQTEVYTEAYIVYDDMLAVEAYSEEYEKLEKQHKEDLEIMSTELTQLRYDRTIEAAMDEINSAQEQLDAGWEELDQAKEQLDSAKDELKEGEQQIKDGEKEIAENEELMAENEALLDEKSQELEYAQWEIWSAQEQYEAGLAEYNAAKAEAEAQLADAEQQLSDAKTQLDTAEAAMVLVEEQYRTAKAKHEEAMSGIEAELEEAIARLNAAQAEYDGLKAEYDQMVLDPTVSMQERLEKLAEMENKRAEVLTLQGEVNAAQKEYDDQKAAADAVFDTVESLWTDMRATYEEARSQYEAGYQEYEKQKADALAQLADAEAQLNYAWSQIQDGQNLIWDGESQIKDGYAQLASGKEQMAAAKDELAAAKEEIEKGKDLLAENEDQFLEGKAELADAQKELDNARSELEDLIVPEWYVNTRDDNAGYAEYGQNAERINNIAKVFPVFFILVAALVCMTTMTRMIEEERTQIGTMKALGYGDGAILSKYLVYTMLATVVGSIVGLVIGFQLFPGIIIITYGIMYDIGVVLTPFMWSEAIVITLAAMLLVGLVVYSCCRNILGPMPAQMMRPKAPKNGKRVLLERIGWLWKMLSFSQKVTVRNIFRYKKRMIMTIAGIAGCTALSLTGFGVKDSVSDIVHNQFEKLWRYQAMIVAEDLNEADHQEVLDILNSYDSQAQLMLSMQKSYTFSVEDTNISATMIVAENTEKLSDFVLLQNRTSEEIFVLEEDGVLVTEKMAKVLGVSPGDSMIIEVDDTRHVTATVQGIVENYANHYAYMLPATYEKLFGEEQEYNMLWAKYTVEDDTVEDRLAAKIIENEHVITVQLMRDLMHSFDTTLQALDAIIWVLIICAGLLAFVVLYNLSNINISERIREIATLEVLGFNDKEVSNYVFRESILLSLIGTVFGLVLGRFLVAYVMQTVELDMVMFGREVKTMSYVYASALTLVFNWIVNQFMKKPLRNISMVESLKSVE